MKKTISKIVASIMAAAMIITASSVPTFARYDESSTEMSSAQNISTLSLNKEVAVTLDTDKNTVKWFKYTASKSSEYVITSISDYDTFVAAYKQGVDGKLIRFASDDQGGEDSNFALHYKIQAGETIYYAVSMYYEDEDGTFDVKFMECEKVSSIVSVSKGEPCFADTSSWSSPSLLVNVQFNSKNKVTYELYYSRSESTHTKALSSLNDMIPVCYYNDVFGNYLILNMTGENYCKIYDKVAGTYPVEVSVKDSDGEVICVANSSITISTVDEYFKDAKLLEYGQPIDVPEGCNEHSPKYYLYKLNVETKGYHIFENINNSLLEDNSKAEFYIKGSDGKTYSIQYIHSSEPTYLPKGECYMIFNAKMSGRYIFGLYDMKAIIPITSFAGTQNATMELGSKKKLTVKLNPAKANETYAIESSNPKVVKVNYDGTVSALSLGTAEITLRAAHCKTKIKVTVTKKTQTITVKKLSKKVKAKKIKKKKYKFSIAKKASALGGASLTFKKVKGTKKIKVSSTGKVTVAKKLKKGKYKISVQINAAENATYKGATVTKKMTVTVK